MSYAFIQDVPANAAMYAEIRAKLPTHAPPASSATSSSSRTRGSATSTSGRPAADWDRFRDDVVEPAVSEVLASYGIPHDHSLVTTTDVTVIDTWLGSTVSD